MCSFLCHIYVNNFRNISDINLKFYILLHVCTVYMHTNHFCNISSILLLVPYFFILHIMPVKPENICVRPFKFCIHIHLSPMYVYIDIVESILGIHLTAILVLLFIRLMSVSPEIFVLGNLNFRNACMYVLSILTPII